MAIVKNQYETFETEKQTGTPRLLVTEQQEDLAQKLYGKSFNELTTNQRFKIRSGKVIEGKFTYEQYLEDYKGMANDPDYKPKYVKANVGTGMSAEQLRARTEAKKTIEGFESKFQKNINRRKALKRALDPVKKERDIIKGTERKQTRRIKGKDVKLSTREKEINIEQRKIQRAFNKQIRNNPDIVLKNEKLMDQLSTTVSKEGDIIKIKPNLSQIRERGLYEIDHQRDIYKTGKMKNLPYNRNLILGPHNRSGGFKAMAEKFIEKNPNDPKVKNIIEKANELKVTLQPTLPEGTFSTKSLGYKQIADPLIKFTEVVKETLPTLQQVDSPGYSLLQAVKNAPQACRKILNYSTGGISTTCAAAIEADPVRAATALEEIKPTSAALGKVRNAASAFLKFAGKGKVFGVTAGVGVGAGALVKKFMNDDPSTYLTNDAQANAMILDTIDEKERQERMEAMGDAPELLDEARIAGEVGVTAAAIPGSGAVYGARKKPFTRMVDGVKKTRPAMGTARAALGPVGKALSGFATPAGIAALTPLNVASSLYEGDSGYEIATDPLNYLAPAFAGTLSKEATRGMGAASKLSKVLRLGMSPGAIKMVSRRFGLPGLALSGGISLYELADDYKMKRGMFGKKE